MVGSPATLRKRMDCNLPISACSSAIVMSSGVVDVRPTSLVADALPSVSGASIEAPLLASGHFVVLVFVMEATHTICEVDSFLDGIAGHLIGMVH